MSISARELTEGGYDLFFGTNTLSDIHGWTGPLRRTVLLHEASLSRALQCTGRMENSRDQYPLLGLSSRPVFFLGSGLEFDAFMNGPQRQKGKLWLYQKSKLVRRRLVNELHLTPAQGAITQLWAGMERGTKEHNGAVREDLASSDVTIDSTSTIVLPGSLGEVRCVSR